MKVIKTKTTEIKLKMKGRSYMTMVANIVPDITGIMNTKQVKLSSTKRFTELTQHQQLADTLPTRPVKHRN